MANVTPVFIPGLLCTEWLFHGQADIASDTAVFADTRQHDTITGMAEAALAQTSGQLVPIGLSMGGYVALEMARLAPARVSALALFSTNCRQDNDAQRAYREHTIKLAQREAFGVSRANFWVNFYRHRHWLTRLLLMVCWQWRRILVTSHLRGSNMPFWSAVPNTKRWLH